MEPGLPRYDVIGRGYSARRRSEPRIARLIHAALGGARSVVNVGAGAGSYEPDGCEVVAVEPSATMIAQRPAGAAPVVQGSAESLPFGDGAFAAAMAVLTMHHWTDWRAGLAEMWRVARGPVVVLTWDPEHTGFWLVRDYFPDLVTHDRRIFPALADMAAALGGAAVSVVPVPHDCVDGFLGAYWRRPDAYLDDGVRASISTFARLDGVEPRVERLRQDLECGQWSERNAAILGQDELDIGYRLVVGRPGA